MKRFKRQAAARKFQGTGTRTMCMALTIGAALVGSTCGKATAGSYEEVSRNYASVTAILNPRILSGPASGIYADPSDGTMRMVSSHRKWKWVTTDIVADPAPARNAEHKYSYNATRDVSASPGAVATATVEFKGTGTFTKSTNGTNEPITGSPKTEATGPWQPYISEGFWYINVAVSVGTRASASLVAPPGGNASADVLPVSSTTSINLVP